MDDSLNNQLTGQRQGSLELGSGEIHWLPEIPIVDVSGLYDDLNVILGAGGMGVVYKAKKRTLEQFVAIKRMKPELGYDLEWQHRFVREATLLAPLSHANVVRIEHWGRDIQGPLMVLEFINGENLAKRLAREGKLEVLRPRHRHREERADAAPAR